MPGHLLTIAEVFALMLHEAARLSAIALFCFAALVFAGVATGAL